MNSKPAHLIILLQLMFFSTLSLAQENLPYYLKDRGTGVPLSMFGTYINEGELIFYPFYEHYINDDSEYSPEELGFTLDEDFRAKSEAHEFLLFWGYGISDMMAVEFEAAVYITETQYKADNDPSAMPNKIEESGLGDIEGQLRWRYNKETEDTPEYFSYFETVFPVQDDEVLIGTTDWEFKLGVGVVSGFTWGTVTARAAVEHDFEEDKTELGEVAVEYLKRVSDDFRYDVVLEGAEDEWEFIVDMQFFLNPDTFIRFNNAFGATSKAEDWAPEIGVVFYFR